MSYEIVRRYSCIGKTFETFICIVASRYTLISLILKKKLIGEKKRFFISPASGTWFILVQLLFAPGYI